MIAMEHNHVDPQSEDRCRGYRLTPFPEKIQFGRDSRIAATHLRSEIRSNHDMEESFPDAHAEEIQYTHKVQG